MEHMSQSNQNHAAQLSLWTDDLLRQLAPLLTLKSLLSLLAACRAFHEVSGIEVFPCVRTTWAEGYAPLMRPVSAKWALDFAGRFGSRLVLASLTCDDCSQEHFDALMKLPLREFACVTRRPIPGFVEQITSVAKLTFAASSLCTLRLQGTHCTDISPVGACKQLCRLAVENPPSLHALKGCAALQDCAKLATLELRGFPPVCDIADGLQAWAQPRSALSWVLSRLTLRSSRVTSEQLDAVAWPALCELRVLDLTRSEGLTHVRALGGCCHLETLTLTACLALTALDGLDACASLQTLRLTSCRRLSSIEALAECPALRVLHLEHCRGVLDASPVGFCTSLRVLHLRCSGVTVVPQRPGLRVVWDNEPES